MTNKNIVELKNINFSYDEMGVLNNLSLDIEKDRVTALLGPSGCGKTTLLNLIAGFYKPQKGEVFIQGQLVADKKSSVPPENRGLGYVFQEHGLLPHLSVKENICLLGKERQKKRLDSAWLNELLSSFQIENLVDRLPNQISGGQRQRVAIARAFYGQPGLVLMDEPFSNLDPQLKKDLMKVTSQFLARFKTSVVIVTHSQEEAFSLANHIVMLQDGRIEQQGTAEQLYKSPQTSFVAEFLGHGSFLDANVVSGICKSCLGEFSTAESNSGKTRLFVRPEDLSLSFNNQGAFKVQWRIFQGDHFNVGLINKEGQELLAQLSLDSSSEPGSKYDVHLKNLKPILF